VAAAAPGDRAADTAGDLRGAADLHGRLAAGLRLDLRADRRRARGGDPGPVLLLLPELLHRPRRRLRVRHRHRDDADHRGGVDGVPLGSAQARGGDGMSAATLTRRRPDQPRSRPARSRLAKRRGPAAWLTLTALVVVTVTILIPFALIALNAFKPPAQYSAHGPLSFPDGFYTGGISHFWDTADFGRALWNSVLISGCVCVLAVLLSVLNAYALGIGRVKGRTWILGAFLIANSLPQEGLVYPLYDLAKEFGVYDSQLAVV